jgi:hypothetical protein
MAPLHPSSYSVTFQAALDLSSIERDAEKCHTEPVLYARRWQVKD